MNVKLLALYFAAGGTIIALVSYFGSQGRA